MQADQALGAMGEFRTASDGRPECRVARADVPESTPNRSGLVHQHGTERLDGSAEQEVERHTGIDCQLGARSRSAEAEPAADLGPALVLAIEETPGAEAEVTPSYLGLRRRGSSSRT